MSVYTLTGAGVQGLTASTVRLFIDVLAFGAGYSTGGATPTNYYHLGDLRLGRDGYYYPVTFVDGAQIVLEVPAGVNLLGYSLFGATSIRVTEAF